MSLYLPKVDFDKLKKRADSFAERDRVEQIADQIKLLDKGMGAYVTSQYVNQLCGEMKAEYKALVEPKLSRIVFDFKIEEI